MNIINMMQHPRTPLIAYSKNVLLKHEGGAGNPAHKYRLAAYLVRDAVSRGVRIRLVVERSSGSMATGLATAAHAFGLPCRLVATAPPDPVVKAIVHAHGGEFVVVGNNSERILALEALVADGAWSTDQHDAGEPIIRAWEQTIGVELVEDLIRAGLTPDNVGAVVAAIGTGGTLAGVVRALRQWGAKPRAIGIDLSSSIVNGGPRSLPVANLGVPGCGSNDERCRTFEIASTYIDELIAIDPLAGTRAMLSFLRSVPTGCGMSGGLVIAAIERHARDLCPSSKTIVGILADRSDRYAVQINYFSALF